MFSALPGALWRQTKPILKNYRTCVCNELYYLPLKAGFLFSKNALMASWLSSVLYNIC